ncbi:MAG: adenylate/guanylate cyclase domain-containing protein [Chloroflexota bacterium]
MNPRDAAEPAVSNVDRRIVSVLFADVVGFTPLSERLDPEDVATIQNAYFTATRETIERHGGVVEKFIGDAVMAVFGAPLARDDDAERAVHAGLALLAAIEQIGARLGMDAGALQLRVGVNTGEVVHATTGPDAGRVTGDTVNTAARLQTAARPGSVLIGELTALTVAHAVDTLDRGPIELKGKAKPMPVWEATAIRSQPSREAAMGSLRAPMLGRQAELANLLELLDEVVRTHGATRVVIIAPPGVGKSRLLAEFSAGVGVTVLRARVRPQGTAPYETVAQLFAVANADLASALADAGVSDARAGVIRKEVADLLEPGGGGSEAVPDIGVEREARFDAWVTALDALVSGPSTWLVEDIHWAGGDLLAFLEFAATAATRHGRLLVATARPSLLASAPSWCAGGSRVDLGPLPAADATALVHALVGDALPPQLVDVVVERSDGTPLFIEELLRTWAGVGTLVREGDLWRLTLRPDVVPLPQTVQAIYAAQLDDLPSHARLVARRGAVAGRRLPAAAFPALDLAAAGDGLDALRRRAILTGPIEDSVTGEGYAYRHALLRDAGYASLARAERCRLHVAMAGWLSDTAGDRADLVAEAIAEHHARALESMPALAPSDLPDRTALAAGAATWYERAADAALRLAAVEAAIRLYRQSLDHSTEDHPRDVARRRLRLGEVLASSAELDLGIEEIVAARVAFAANPAAQDEYERATYALGMAYMQQIRFPEVTALTTEGIAHLGGAVSAMTARLLALHAWSLAANGHPDGTAAEVDQALAAAREAVDPSRELDVLSHWCAVRDEIGASGEGDWELLEQRALALQRWGQVVVAGRVRAMRHSFTDPAGALPLLASVVETAAAHGLTEQRGWCEYARCETLWVLGEFDAALASGIAALELAEQYAYHRLAFRTFMILLPIAAARGDPATAERWERWWAVGKFHFPPNPSAYGQMLRGAYLVWLAQATGAELPEPPAELVDAMQPMENPHYLAAVETVVRTWLDAGRGDLAGAMASRVAAEFGTDAAAPLMRASAALVDAWVNGSQDAARRAAELAASLPAPWWEARARAAID